MGLIVRYHQYINRCYEKFVKCTQYTIMVMSFIILMDSCFNIFFIMKVRNPKVIMTHVSTFIFNNIFILLSYYSGQQISNQNEIFRRYLAELPWINKPKWFKQSMIIIMSRANVDTQIKPYGIFYLNLTSYKDLLKAAFSFANILYTYKMARGEQ
ncbi:uncharacterized protein LOC111054398 [Nilaparvata lugens]|uniref:uncharacterized protein LOC111054398 n=1 Tax=Nilaparvata lugens TaxID=108931 RepID=UPI00193EB21D|nr:uncharacterized protein LOC111054398 [Nilaparvata lugens]